MQLIADASGNTGSPLTGGSFLRSTLAILACLVLVSNCGSAEGGKSDTNGREAVSAVAPEPTRKSFEDFDATTFERSTSIDNVWMPTTPGLRMVYEGVTIDDDGSSVPHRLVVHVTDLTKVIGGVRTVVTLDLDYSDGELGEADLAFFAEDKAGNVWLMGEYPEEYDAGKIVGHPSWIHGIEGARAGIMMMPKPQAGTPSYSEGWGPAVGWTDRGQVDQVGQKTCVPVDCYEDVLIIAETSASEPDAQQLKYYAPNVGNIKVGWRGAGEKVRETLDLVKVEKMDAKALAQVRAKVLALEKSAYKNSKTVYALTPPMVNEPGGRAPAAIGGSNGKSK